MRILYAQFRLELEEEDLPSSRSSPEAANSAFDRTAASAAALRVGRPAFIIVGSGGGGGGMSDDEEDLLLQSRDVGGIAEGRRIIGFGRREPTPTD